jgi:hypothetical protein
MLSLGGTRGFAFAALTSTALGVAVTHAGQDAKAPSDTPITAIYKIERIEFAYKSPNIRYACESLQKRTRQILEAVGAYPKMVVEVKNCQRQEQVRHAEMVVTFAMPVEATEENIRAMVDFDSRDELVARVRKEHLPSAEDVQRFPATWRSVTLSGSAPLKLAAGDCDLLRVMRDEVFPRLNVRVVGSGMNCGAGPDTRIMPRIRVYALMPEKLGSEENSKDI